MIIKFQQFSALIWKWNIGFRHVQFLWGLCLLILLLKLKLYSSMVLVSLRQFGQDSNVSQMGASHLRNCYRLIDLMRIFLVVVVIVVHRLRRSQPTVSSSNSRQGGMHEKCSWTNLSEIFPPRRLILFWTSVSCPSSYPAIPQCWTGICNQTNALFCQAAFGQCYITTAEKQIRKKNSFNYFLLSFG